MALPIVVRRWVCSRPADEIEVSLTPLASLT